MGWNIWCFGIFGLSYQFLGAYCFVRNLITFLHVLGIWWRTERWNLIPIPRIWLDCVESSESGTNWETINLIIAWLMSLIKWRTLEKLWLVRFWYFISPWKRIFILQLSVFEITNKRRSSWLIFGLGECLFCVIPWSFIH